MHILYKICISLLKTIRITRSENNNYMFSKNNNEKTKYKGNIYNNYKRLKGKLMNGKKNY